MKSKFSMKSLIAIVLTICMITSALPMQAIALGADAFKANGGKVNYVSIGDSMSNGYGFVGYNQNATTSAEYDFVNGIGVQGNGAYPQKFAEYLKTEFGCDVNHTMLTPSGLLTYDVLYLLGAIDADVYDGWIGYKDYVGNYVSAANDTGEPEQALKDHFKNAITNADIITFGLGNAHFGAYLMSTVTSAIGILGGTATVNPDLTLENGLALLENEEAKNVVLKIYNEMKTELTTYVAASGIAIDVNVVMDIVAYTAANFLVTYEMLLDEIVRINPDVEIILVGLMNTTYGMNIKGADFEFAFGDFMDNAFTALNTYIAGIPAAKQLTGEYAEAKFYFAEQPNPDFIVNAFDDFYNGGWNDVDNGRLSAEIVRKRNITSFNKMILPIFEGVLNGDKKLGDAGYVKLPEVTLEKVNAFNGNTWTANFYDEFAVAAYLATEKATAMSIGTMEISVDGLLGIAAGGNALLDALGTMPDALLRPTEVTPEEFKNAVADWFASETGKPMCKVYALFAVGDGMSVHPTPTGHDNITASVISAYESGYTATDYVKGIAAEILALVKTYGPGILDAAYNWAEKEGYFDGAQAFATDLELSLAAWEQLLVSCGSDLVKLEAACGTIATELQALLVKHNVPELAVLVKSYLQQAMDYLKPYEEQIKMVLAAAGASGLYMLYEYLIDNNYLQGTKLTPEQLQAQIPVWIDQLAATDYAALAREIMQYMIDNDVLGQIDYKALHQWVLTYVAPVAEQIALKLGELVAAYGPTVLREVFKYADAKGHLDGLYAMNSHLQTELNTKIGQWTALLEQVKNDAAAMQAVCKQIISEFVTLLETYDVEDRINDIYNIFNEVMDIFNSNQGNLANALYALVERYGTDAVDMILSYLDSIGVFDEAKALEAAVNGKIADWKALIAAAGNDPKALLAAAQQIAEEAWALVEQFDLVGKAEKTVEIITNVVDVMLSSGENLGNAIYALVEQYGAEALAAIMAVIEKSGYMDEAEAYINAIKANINNWIDMIEAIPTHNAEMLKAVCEQIANELKALAQQLDREDAQALLTGILSSAAKVFGDIAAEYGDEIAAVLGVAGGLAAQLIYNYLLDNGYIDHANGKLEDLKNTVEQWKNDIESLTKDDYLAYAKQIAQYLLTHVGMTQENFETMCAWIDTVVNFYQANIDNKTMEELKAVLVDMMKLYGEEAFDKFVEHLEAAGWLDMAEGQVNALKAQIETWKAKLAEILKNAKDLDVEAELKALAEEVWQYLIGTGLIPVNEINAVKTWIEDILDFYYTNIAGATKQELLNVLADMIRAYGEEAFDKFVDYLEQNEYVIAASAKAEALRAQVEEWKQQYLDLKAKVESITDEDVIAFAEDVWNYIVDNNLITIDNIQNLLNWAKAEVLAHIEALESAVEQLLNKATELGILTEEAVVEIVSKINELKSFVEGVSVDITGMINELIQTATKTTYTITGKDNYLVLGSSTAFGTGVGRDDSLYSELLFDKIFNKTGSYANKAEQNLAYTGILSYLAGLEKEIAEATLITYQQDAGALLYAAINNKTPDWSAYLTAEQIAMANEIIANAIARLPENVNREVLAIVRPMIENTVYAIVGYAIDTMKGIEYINAINSDVTIVIPGMYNPIRGIKLDVKGVMIDLEAVFEYVIDATNVYYFACGAAYENVTFVDVSETETKGFDSTIVLDSLDYSALVSVLRGDGMYATAAGHEYIYECIINAVTFEYELIGDVNLDGSVTVADVALLYQYLLNKAELSEQALANGDVNLDGEITMADITALYLMVRNMDE